MKTKSVPFISHPRDSMNREREGGEGGIGEVRGGKKERSEVQHMSKISFTESADSAVENVKWKISTGFQVGFLVSSTTDVLCFCSSLRLFNFKFTTGLNS
jgi:hypothetical protein